MNGVTHVALSLSAGGCPHPGKPHLFLFLGSRYPISDGDSKGEDVDVEQTLSPRQGGYQKTPSPEAG